MPFRIPQNYEHLPVAETEATAAELEAYQSWLRTELAQVTAVLAAVQPGASAGGRRRTRVGPAVVPGSAEDLGADGVSRTAKSNGVRAAWARRKAQRAGAPAPEGVPAEFGGTPDAAPLP
jgi:Tfp pilus assembly protein FimV